MIQPRKTPITHELLRSLRNDLPMAVTLANMGVEAPPFKDDGGRWRFACSRCGEVRAVLNPKNNLAHCFCCQKNTNNIDLLIENGYTFIEAVALLSEWLKLHRSRQMEASRQKPTHPARTITDDADGRACSNIGEILRREIV